MIRYSEPPALMRIPRFVDRRSRLIHFAESYGGGHPFDLFTITVGMNRLEWKDLTDDALERITLEMVRDYWRSKRRTRENRVSYARWLAEQAGKKPS